ncbi:11102_t:CDS:1, partial [Gigaspora rosea]
ESRFGLMKKALDLAVSTSQAKEFYKIYLKLIEEIKNEIARKTKKNLGQDNDLTEFTEFAHTINNPISIRLKE